MLQELRVRDLGVIDDASLELGPGLNVVTGETGAGKTLLVTSLVLLTGGRGESRLVRHGADEALIEAVLSVPEGVRPLLAERGLDDTEEIVVVRRIGADGRSRAWISGSPVPISTLDDVCGRLVEVCGQGASFGLARPSAQLEALDAAAGTSPVLGSYREALGEVRSLEAERSRLLAAAADRDREIDLLRFQAEEIERADPEPDEDETLAVEIGRLEHVERLQHAGLEALAILSSEGAAGGLAEVHKILSDASRHDPGLAPLVERIGGLAAEVADAAGDLRSWSEGLDPDPGRLEALRERAAFLQTLKRKYGGTLDAVIRTGTDARRRLDELEGVGGRIDEVDAALAAARDRLDGLAADLSARRREGAGELAGRVSAELPSLALPKAVFQVACEPGHEDGPRGRDRVEFRFSAQPDRPPGPLGKVASGGELSRAMIALTLALTRDDATPVLVFDEADQGVGGRAALELARRLARLGRDRQVLVVSHLPQIAAFAERHLVVRKDAGGVGVGSLEDPDRLEEISRMLAGLASSDLAQAHAAELVDLARAERAGGAAVRAS